MAAVKKKLSILVGTVGIALAVAAPAHAKYPHNNIGVSPEWSTVNCDGREISVFVPGGANPTDMSDYCGRHRQYFDSQQWG